MDELQDAVFLLSSGTTGRSKIIPITYKNLFKQVEVLQKHLSFDETTRTLNIIGPSHVDGLITGLLLSFCQFSTIIYINNEGIQIKNDHTISYLERFNVTILLTTPTNIIFLLKYVKDMQGTFKRLKRFKFAITTAAYISGEHCKEFQEKTKKPIYNIYGMTEIGTLISIAKPEHYQATKFNTIGPVVIGEYLILDKDGKEVSENEVGEMIVTGPTVIDRYIGEEIKFIEKYNKKWFITGDLIKVVDGLLVYCERKKKTIISAGLTVIPQEINKHFFKSSRCFRSGNNRFRG